MTSRQFSDKLTNCCQDQLQLSVNYDDLLESDTDLSDIMSTFWKLYGLVRENFCQRMTQFSYEKVWLNCKTVCISMTIKSTRRYCKSTYRCM